MPKLIATSAANAAPAPCAPGRVGDPRDRRVLERAAESERHQRDSRYTAGDLRAGVGECVAASHLAQPQVRERERRVHVRARALAERRVDQRNQGETHRRADQRAPNGFARQRGNERRAGRFERGRDDPCRDHEQSQQECLDRILGEVVAHQRPASANSITFLIPAGLPCRSDGCSSIGKRPVISARTCTGQRRSNSRQMLDRRLERAAVGVHGAEQHLVVQHHALHQEVGVERDRRLAPRHAGEHEHAVGAEHLHQLERGGRRAARLVHEVDVAELHGQLPGRRVRASSRSRCRSRRAGRTSGSARPRASRR